MYKKEYRVIGVMSGTSLDGIDLVYVNFLFEDYWRFKILKFETKPYTQNWVDQLSRLVDVSLEELRRIDLNYTQYLAEKINEFIIQENIEYIDAVCSHGHTALHKPEDGLTYQIGNLKVLSDLLNLRVVCDFRVQDVKLGGQGAPLVPIGDKLLFSEYDMCLNLGGFANISVNSDDERIAFDVCPANIVLNHFVKQLGLEYDDKGKIASKGEVNHELLKELNALEFYKKEHPKSLGLEWVIASFLPVFKGYEISVENVLRTCVEHIAIQISSTINQFSVNQVLITGGGTYNNFLIERIKKLSSTNIVIPSSEIIEYKEALIFGFLGVLKLRDEVNCLSSVTGAKQDHSSGKIFHP